MIAMRRDLFGIRLRRVFGRTVRNIRDNADWPSHQITHRRSVLHGAGRLCFFFRCALGPRRNCHNDGGGSQRGRGESPQGRGTSFATAAEADRPFRTHVLRSGRAGETPACGGLIYISVTPSRFPSRGRHGVEHDQLKKARPCGEVGRGVVSKFDRVCGGSSQGVLGRSAEAEHLRHGPGADTTGIRRRCFEPLSSLFRRGGRGYVCPRQTETMN